jgi:hypothetical protein
MFNSKNWHLRLTETIHWLDQYIGANPMWQEDQANNLLEWLSAWSTADLTIVERHRVSDAMEQGPFGNSMDRVRRRAVILLRTAILRHEVTKTKNEFNGTATNQLDTLLKNTVGLCLNFADRPPPWLKRVSLIKNEQAMLQHLNDWVFNWRTNAASASLSGRDLESYQRYTDAHDKVAAENANKVGKTIVYIPVPGDQDAAIQANLRQFSFLTDDADFQSAFGRNQLAQLQEGGELRIVGHGNFGSAIGGHHVNLGAQKLMQALWLDGLPENPDAPVWIYLWACWTATHTRRGIGGFGKREPYSRRFARALANGGFNKYFVVGFAGSVDRGNVERTVTSRNGPAHDSRTLAFDQANYVVYEVNTGDYNRIHGEDWTTQLNYHVGWNKPSYYEYTVDKRRH